MSATSDFVRENFSQGDDIRDAGLTTPEEIRRFDNLQYGPDPDWQLLDVYRPKAAEDKTLPVIVSVHGGGWVYGDKERYQYYCMDLAGRGFAVVNFTYRLAPEYKFPASLEDTNLVFSWVLRHASEYGFDTEHIFAVGDSAGAHNLGLYACLCTNPEYAKQYADVFAPPEGFAPEAIVLNCGVYRVTAEGNETDDLTRSLMADLLPDGGTEEELQRICVRDYVTEKFPPAFVMTATGDFLKGQPSVLIPKLLEYDIPFTFRYYGDGGRAPLGHVFHLNIRSADAKLCNDEECAFLERFVSSQQSVV